MLSAKRTQKSNKVMQTKVHIWQEIPSSHEEDVGLEDSLSFPAGTIAIWRKALELNLPRTVAWEVATGLSKEPFLQAVKFYKRGFLLEQKVIKTAVSFKSFKQLQGFINLNEAFIVYDANVLKCWPQLKQKRAGSFYLYKDPSEANKSLETLAAIISSYKKKPSLPIIAIGGGVTLDVASFAASLLQQSVVLVPTTFLAMVDASLGGKNGVNFWPYGKNLIGSFYFPREILICCDFLETLNSRELCSGGAEALKHALLLSDKKLLRELSQNLFDRDKESLGQKIVKLVKVKKNIVCLDPFEKSYRMILNLGHTLAHGIEALSAKHQGSTIAHGEAVALGLFFVSFLSRAQGFITVSEAIEIQNQLKKSSCLISSALFENYTGFSPLDPKTWLALQSYLSQDKKQFSQCDLFHDWVLLRSEGFMPGEGRYLTRVAAHVSESVWYEMWKKLGD